ncbi:hypothetical protein [Methanoplanus endosymbiosus]|uniref:Uncharacterized protein n=1 Tax=Methanoplanus endosymbiosus TaxID=33865 RepID=A0A9E7TKZ4_9EURY|nr:hypothetical protein [Methanoplanus endosymbiosus]UUX93269.1 hypothetical protein L6E24_03850 [Methanoplanus endosymbiosus]
MVFDNFNWKHNNRGTSDPALKKPSATGGQASQADINRQKKKESIFAARKEREERERQKKAQKQKPETYRAYDPATGEHYEIEKKEKPKDKYSDFSGFSRFAAETGINVGGEFQKANQKINQMEGVDPIVKKLMTTTSDVLGGTAQVAGFAPATIEKIFHEGQEKGAVGAAGTVAAATKTGLAYQAKSAVENPVDTALQLAVGGVILGGAKGVTKPITKPFGSYATEAGIIIRAPKTDAAAIHATSNIGRLTKNVNSKFLKDPDLTKIRNLGPQSGKTLESILSNEPHSLYGTVTTYGQMPKPPRVTSDLDVFVKNPAAFNENVLSKLGKNYEIKGSGIVNKVGAEKTAHAVDTHPIPDGYPGFKQPKPVKTNIYTGDKAPKLPFDWMPDKLLKADKLTQEPLYSQAGRKAAGVMGGPEGKLKWKYGPAPHRGKDLVDLVDVSQYLAEQKRQTINPFKKVQAVRLQKSIDTLKGTGMYKDALKASQKEITGKPGELTININKSPSPGKINVIKPVFSPSPTIPGNRRPSPTPSKPKGNKEKTSSSPPPGEGSKIDYDFVGRGSPKVRDPPIGGVPVVVVPSPRPVKDPDGSKVPDPIVGGVPVIPSPIIPPPPGGGGRRPNSMKYPRYSTEKKSKSKTGKKIQKSGSEWFITNWGAGFRPGSGLLPLKIKTPKKLKSNASALNKSFKPLKLKTPKFKAPKFK